MPILALVLAAGLSGGANLRAAEAPARQFRAGAAVSNVTPPLGQPIVGGWNAPPATHVHDELHARCLVLDNGRTRLAVAVVDNVGVPREVFDEAKRLTHQATGIPTENMLMAATHTHSATSARGPNRLVYDTELTAYQRFLAERIADGVRRAVHNLAPARIGWAVADAPGHVFNRRWFMKPGTPTPNPFGGRDPVVMNPGRGNPNLLRPADTTDPQVPFLSIQARSGRPIALLANYSLHYVGGVPGGEISADYFALFADRVQQLLGADRLDPPFVGIMTNGTSGDINNIDVRGRRTRRRPYEQMRRVAHQVADAVLAVHKTIEFHDWVELGARQSELTLEVRKPTAAQLARARQVLAAPDAVELHHRREPVYARRLLRLAEAPNEVRVLLQALRIGDVGIAAIPFEVFVATGLEIKKRCPLQPAFTVSLANGSYGYLPTPRHHELGGYETWLGTNVVEVEASTKIVDRLLTLFGRLDAER